MKAAKRTARQEKPPKTRGRLKREPAARTGPIRNVSMAFRKAGQQGNDTSPAAVSVAERAVSTAYRVIDEYLRRGQDAASRHVRSEAAGGPMKDDRQDMAAMAMRYWQGMAQMWLGAMQPFMPWGVPQGGQSWEMGGPMKGAAPTAAGGAQPAQARGSTARIAVEVSSAQPTEVSVELHDPSANKNLAAHDLHGGAGKPPISAVDFDFVKGRVRVKVTVPRDQPPGVYVGAIVDKATGEARGTLEVTIREKTSDKRA